MADNTLRIEVYSSGGSRIMDPLGELNRAEGITFETIYPGGLFGAANIYIPRDLIHSWQVSGANRVVIRNGDRVVYEGYISNLPVRVDETNQGITICCNGAWGHILQNRLLSKPWADARIDASVWKWQALASGAEKCTYDRNSRLRLTPKNVAWTTNQLATIIYGVGGTISETIKRVTFDYDFQEGAQQWEFGLSTGSETLFSVTASGTGTQDITLATPRQSFYFYFMAAANQTPASDGTIYGEASNIVVYTETGAINLTEIAKDCAAFDSRISTDFSLIGSNTLDLTPFTTQSNFITLADILTSAAKYGDSSYNCWAVGVRESDAAVDSKPILYAEAYPVTTDYDYTIGVNERNLVPPLDISQDFDSIANMIFRMYTNTEGITVCIAGGIPSGTGDSASIAAYGQRDRIINTPTTSATVGTNAAKRYLAAYKNPQWRVNGSINVQGYIRGKANEPIPACQVRAGKRIRIENLTGDLSDSGKIFLITGTSYSDADQTCQITVGQADPLDALLAQLQMGK